MARDEATEREDAGERTCIVSRVAMPPEHLIRFVAAPDGAVVPDLRRRLPGRGVHVEMRREAVAEAVRRRLFGRGLKREVRADAGLADLVDGALARQALGFFGLARKAGQVVTGASQTDAAVRGGAALAVVHATDAAPDGLRKLDAARFAAAEGDADLEIPAFRPGRSDELGLAIGGDNVIHAAVLAGEAGTALVKRLAALARYRGEALGGRASRLACSDNETTGPAEGSGMDDGPGSDPARNERKHR